MILSCSFFIPVSFECSVASIGSRWPRWAAASMAADATLASVIASIFWSAYLVLQARMCFRWASISSRIASLVAGLEPSRLALRIFSSRFSQTEHFLNPRARTVRTLST